MSTAILESDLQEPIKSFLSEEYQVYYNNEIQTLKISDLCKYFTVLVFYPLDFTFVCPTELKKMSDLAESFKKKNTSVIYISCDSVYSHKAWCEMSTNKGGIGPLKWPMVSDMSRSLSTYFSMFDINGSKARRGTVILNSRGDVKYSAIYDDLVGRSTDETFRILDALKLIEEGKSFCGVDFTKEE